MLKTLGWHCPVELSVMLEMFYILFDTVATSLMCLLNTSNVASIIVEK